MKIAFDIDGTLIHQVGEREDTPRYEVLDLFWWFWNNYKGAEIYVWSGGGIEYAKRWVQKLGIDSDFVDVIEKGSIEVDIAVDDEDVKLGKVNLKV